MRLVDLTGQKFDKLTVVEFMGTESKGAKAKWLCRCECGSVVSVYSTNLRRGYTRACGKCRHNIGNQYGTYNLKEYDSAFNIFYRTVKTSAVERNLEFSLGMDDVRSISSRNCFYCGTHPYQVVKVRNKFGSDFVYNGIDRVDNAKGYVLDNVVPCCKKCNQAKMNLSVDEFRKLVVSMYNHWAGK